MLWLSMRRHLWRNFVFTNIEPLTNDDKILMRTLRLEKGCSALTMMLARISVIKLEEKHFM